MTGREIEVEKLAVIRLKRLNALAHGISLGLIAGLGLFVGTNWLVIKGGEVVGPNLSLLGQYFIGYRVTFLGSFIGFAYAGAVGFVFGYAMARVYNLMASKRGTHSANDA